MTILAVAIASVVRHGHVATAALSSATRMYKWDFEEGMRDIANSKPTGPPIAYSAAHSHAKRNYHVAMVAKIVAVKNASATAAPFDKPGSDPVLLPRGRK